MKEVRVKNEIKEKYDKKGKEGEKRDAQMWKAVKTCVRKKVKKAHTCNSINTSVGVQNRLTIWKTIDSGRYAI